ncbi:MAG: hypothetical protein KF869_02230 [Phycisphaeraceae bacterium]|nr:hypothetical protein [Phycisphaeraceae bacterium]
MIARSLQLAENIDGDCLEHLSRAIEPLTRKAAPRLLIRIEVPARRREQVSEKWPLAAIVQDRPEIGCTDHDLWQARDGFVLPDRQQFFDCFLVGDAGQRAAGQRSLDSPQCPTTVLRANRRMRREERIK